MANQIFYHYSKQLWLAVILLFPVQAWSMSLSMQEAVQMALERDAMIQAYQANGQSLQEQSVAEDTLPDPKLKFGFMNFPTDTFARDQEPMTQVVVGVQQMFPAGDTLAIKSQRAMNMASMQQAMAENQRRKVTSEVRKLWLELFYWQQAQEIVKKNRRWFKELVSVTRQQYAAGRQQQQDVIRSELELGMLEDRESQINIMLETTRVKLARYIGDAAQRSLESNLPGLSIRSLANWLEQHPMMQAEQANISSNENNVALARQSYKPAWMLDVTYGFRDGKNPNGTDRADFLSAMVIMDLPLFTGDRQDKNVAASKYKLNSALSARDERARELTQMWHSNNANLTRLEQRIKQYQNLLLPKANENSKAALYAYQSGRGNFSALMRAQITELETQLQALRLQVDQVKTKAELLYLSGE